MDHLDSSFDSYSGVYTRRGERLRGRPSRLGQAFKEARRDKRLELEDLAELTNIRLSHLEAIEAGNFSELPEDPHSKTVVRRYAQAVGLDPARTLLLYTQERRSQASDAPKELELPPEAPSLAPFDDPRLGHLARMLLTLAVVVSLVLAALWLFNTLWGASGSPADAARRAPAAAADARLGDDAVLDAPSPTPPAMSLMTLSTTPAGAEISIDGYRIGQSPLEDVPVRAGQRLIRVERGGYKPFERRLEVTSSRRVHVVLSPTQSADTSRLAAAPENAVVTVRVSAPAWLEVYAGTARGEGERLVYETAQPGRRYTFEQPVFIFTGNAGGVLVSQNGGEAEALGDPGALVGKAFKPQSR